MRVSGWVSVCVCVHVIHTCACIHVCTCVHVHVYTRVCVTKECATSRHFLGGKAFLRVPGHQTSKQTDTLRTCIRDHLVQTTLVHLRPLEVDAGCQSVTVQPLDLCDCGGWVFLVGMVVGWYWLVWWL